MKNSKNKLSYVLCMLFSCVLISCGTESVKISDAEPFIVGKITLRDGMYKYERAVFKSSLTEPFAMEKQSITVDYNLQLQVGDTLRVHSR